MNLIEEHWEFTRITATAQAVEICRATGRMQDCQDVTQDILAFVSLHIDNYDSARSQPKTYINMLIKYAKKIIMRKHYRMKKRFGEIITENIEDYQDRIFDERDEMADHLKEWIQDMEEGETKDICAKLFIEQETPYKVGIAFGKTKDEIISIAKKAMAPIARDLGLIRDDAAQPQTVSKKRGGLQKVLPKTDFRRHHGGSIFSLTQTFFPGARGRSETFRSNQESSKNDIQDKAEAGNDGA